MNTTIGGLQQHFARLYGRRNLFTNNSLAERVIHMTRRIGRLADAERKNQDMAGRLARAFSYCMSMINCFNGEVKLIEGMVRKFPLYGCSYCGYMPCKCGEDTRPEPKNEVPDYNQHYWTLRDWQTHFAEVYGPKNKVRGFWQVLGRTMSEFGEFGILNVHGPETPLKSSEIVVQLEDEGADLMSWIAALAFLKEVDLQAEVEKRYEVCPGCHEIPCDCPIIIISHDGTKFSSIRDTRKAP
jgi:hypothetical protein